jgi:hypothetical protein
MMKLAGIMMKPSHRVHHPPVLLGLHFSESQFQYLAVKNLSQTVTARRSYRRKRGPLNVDCVKTLLDIEFALKVKARVINKLKMGKLGLKRSRSILHTLG